MKKFLTFLCAMLLVFGLVGQASAFTIPLTNPSFEEDGNGNPLVLINPIYNLSLPGWQIFGGAAGAFDSSSTSAYSAAELGEIDGNNVAWAAAGAGFYQNVGATLNADNLFKLTFLVGNRLDAPGTEYTVRFQEGSSILGTPQSFSAPRPGTFEEVTVEFYNQFSLPGDLYVVIINSTSSGGSGAQLNFDNFLLEIN